MSLLALAIGILIPARSANSQPAVAGCRLERAIGVPFWVTTGSWQGDNLVVVNVVGRKLTQISRTGTASDLRTALGDYLQAFSPLRIRDGRRTGGDRSFLIQVESGILIDVDRNLTPRRQLGLATAGLRSADGSLIDSKMLIDWVWAGDQIIGYADIQGPGEGRESWKNGFVRFDADQPKSFSIIRERRFPDNARVSMTLTYPLLAGIGSVGYVALVDGQMGLWRFGPNDQELRSMQAFPVQLKGKRAPMLPHWLKQEEFPAVMAAVERQSMPAGLWAWDNSLFLLFRTFEGGRRNWYLSKIDPRRDMLLWTVQVPGSANHLTVIPGPDEWAFLEKGPVTDWLSQETHHIRFVSSARFRSTSLTSLCPGS